VAGLLEGVSAEGGLTFDGKIAKLADMGFYHVEGGQGSAFVDFAMHMSDSDDESLDELHDEPDGGGSSNAIDVDDDGDVLPGGDSSNAIDVDDADAMSDDEPGDGNVRRPSRQPTVPPCDRTCCSGEFTPPGLQDTATLDCPDGPGGWRFGCWGGCNITLSPQSINSMIDSGRSVNCPICRESLVGRDGRLMRNHAAEAALAALLVPCGGCGGLFSRESVHAGTYACPCTAPTTPLVQQQQQQPLPPPVNAASATAAAADAAETPPRFMAGVSLFPAAAESKEERAADMREDKANLVGEAAESKREPTSEPTSEAAEAKSDEPGLPPMPQPIAKSGDIRLGQVLFFEDQHTLVVDYGQEGVTLMPSNDVKDHYENRSHPSLMPRPLIVNESDLIGDADVLEYRPRDLSALLGISAVTLTRILQNYPRDLPRSVVEVNAAAEDGEVLHEEAGIRDHHYMINRIGENIRRLGWHYFGDESSHATMMQEGLDGNHRAVRASGQRESGDRYGRTDVYQGCDRQPPLTGAETDALRLLSTRSTRIGGGRFPEEIVDVTRMDSAALSLELSLRDLPHAGNKPMLGEAC
jgi:hypothetical protein